MSGQRRRSADLKSGRIRSRLPHTLVARVRVLCSTLEEVYPVTPAKWLKGLRGEQDPAGMVLRWEQLARCYTDYGRHHELDSEQRRAAFQVISKLAAGASLKKLRVDLAHLPAGALEEILAILGQTAPGSS